MKNCIVTKIDGSVNNQNLESFKFGYKDYATNNVATQNVYIVGTGLPVTTISTGTHKVRVSFRSTNGNTTGVLLMGKSGGNTRMLFSKNYEADSSGSATLECKAEFGAGSPDLLNRISKDTFYTVLFQLGSVVVYDANGDIVQTKVLSESNVLTIDSLYFNLDKLNMWNIEGISIEDTNGTLILNAIPMDNNGRGCLYDSVNDTYYYSDSGNLTVADYD